LTRLLDLGIDRIRNIIMDMSKLSENSVFAAIESYEQSTHVKKQIFDWSERLRILQDEVSDLAIELIALYQPVATDLRFIKSCMEIAYGFSRFGRYAYDIAEILETIGSVSECDKSAVLEMSKTVREMILLSLEALRSRDKDASQRLYEMDNIVDTHYRKYIHDAIIKQEEENPNEKVKDLRCYICSSLILRYLERISDHACYIADSVVYIVTGSSSPRR
jgi:phosphate transport system protein